MRFHSIRTNEIAYTPSLLIKRFACTIFLSVLPFCLQLSNTMTVAAAQLDTHQPVGDTTAKADIQTVDIGTLFSRLHKNRAIYQAYNDSITIISKRKRWMSLFQRRATAFHDIYRENREIINELRTYLDGDTAFSDSLRQRTYDDLIKNSIIGVENKLDDPFLSLYICKRLMKYYESGTCPDSVNYAGYVLTHLGTIYYNIYMISGDTSLITKAYDCYTRAASGKYDNMPFGLKSHIVSNNNLLKTQWVKFGCCTANEIKNLVNRQLALLKTDTAKTLFQHENLDRLTKSATQTEARLTRNVFMTDSSSQNKHKVDSLMTIAIKQNLAQKNISARNRVNTIIMRMKLGQITAEDALKETLGIRNSQIKEVKKTRLDDFILSEITNTYLNFFYINDIAPISNKQKHDNAQMLWDDIVIIFHQRKDCQSSNYYISVLTKMIFYDRATRHLKDKEKVHYITELMVAVQVPTYAHSVHVGQIAEAITRSALRNRPDLFTSLKEMPDVKTVRRSKRKILDFMRKAALYHDLGKNSISPVVNNDFRPLTSMERAILQLHPTLGIKYLDISPSFAKYHDTTLGHHKWYNGECGYPAEFDNTKSDIRLLIDILTISDCLQAATERLSRNYRDGKTLDKMMEEFISLSGTRYNPDFVTLMDTDTKLRAELEDLVSNGWYKIYWDIYSRYF